VPIGGGLPVWYEDEMKDSVEWKAAWAERAREEAPDFNLDRGFSKRREDIERLSERELIEFIDPHSSETVLDAGCGTGVNISRLCGSVKRIIGVDYTAGSIERCRKRIEAQNIQNCESAALWILRYVAAAWTK